MPCHNGCRVPCNCKQPVPTVVQLDPETGESTSTIVQPAAGTGEKLCWGMAGGEQLNVAPGATVVVSISVENYSWLRPRKMTATITDPLLPDINGAPFARVLGVKAVGRDVIGSQAGVSASSMDNYAQNALTFGADISAINAANKILVTVRNDGPNFLNMAFDVEGRAAQ